MEAKGKHNERRKMNIIMMIALIVVLVIAATILLPAKAAMPEFARPADGCFLLDLVGDEAADAITCDGEVFYLSPFD